MRTLQDVDSCDQLPSFNLTLKANDKNSYLECKLKCAEDDDIEKGGEPECTLYHGKDKIKVFKKDWYEIYIVKLDTNCFTLSFKVDDIPIEWEAWSGNFEESPYVWNLQYWDPFISKFEVNSKSLDFDGNVNFVPKKKINISTFEPLKALSGLEDRLLGTCWLKYKKFEEHKDEGVF